MKKRFVSRGLLAGLIAGVSANVLAESPHSVSANIGVVSNYLWRGVTQTDDKPAIQGGIDYAHSSGLSVGTWVSNIDWGTDTGTPNYELDLYGGYGGAFGDFGYSIDAIYYAYPDAEDGDKDADFAEIGLSGSWQMLTVGVNYTVYGENDDGLFDNGDLYYYASAEFPLPQDFALSAEIGHYSFENDDIAYERGDGSIGTKSADYTHWGAGISKSVGDFGTVAFNYTQNSGSDKIGYDDDAKVWVSWLKEF